MTRIECLDRQDAWRVLSNNLDYYQTFTPLDLHARKVESIGQYLAIIQQDIVDPRELPKKDRDRLVKASLEADRRLSTILEKATKIEWRFIVMKGTRYENGFPHTIPGGTGGKSKSGKSTGGYIVLFRDLFDKQLLPTLIHEKVHLYQRLYPEETMKLIQTTFRPLRKRSKRSRANPDIDDMVWQHRRTGKVYESCYRSDHPRSISDVSGNEHPLEEIAYQIEKKLSIL